MTWDDVLVDGVDTIDAARWNGTITEIKTKSVSTHTHLEFSLYTTSDNWYIYVVGSTYYAKNLNTGTIDYSGADFSTIMNTVIGMMPQGGFIKIGTGTFIVTTAISTECKSIIIEGSGWGGGDSPELNPGTLIISDTTGAFYLFTFGDTSESVRGAGIRNCMIMNNPANTECLGAVHLLNMRHSFAEHCLIYGFELGNPTAMKAICIDGTYARYPGGLFNRVLHNHIYFADVGVFLGNQANYCTIENNEFIGSGTAAATAIKFDGTGATIASPYGCKINGNRIYNFSFTASRGVWVSAAIASSGRHTFINNEFSVCYINVEVTSGTDIGDCAFIGNILGAAGSSIFTDNGNVKSKMVHNKGYITDNSGAVSKADGATVTHGLATTPTAVNVNASVANEFVSVTALSSTTFTVAIKKHDGSAGTSQTIYWRAWI